MAYAITRDGLYRAERGNRIRTVTPPSVRATGRNPVVHTAPHSDITSAAKLSGRMHEVLRIAAKYRQDMPPYSARLTEPHIVRSLRENYMIIRYSGTEWTDGGVSK